MSDNTWMKGFFERTKATTSFESMGKKNTGFYTHCECCDATLSSFQMPSGLCGECFDIVVNTSSPSNHFHDTWYIENELWRNPQGGDETEMFNDHGDECE